MNSESTKDRMITTVSATKIIWLVLGRFVFFGWVLLLAMLGDTFPAFLERCIQRPISLSQGVRAVDKRWRADVVGQCLKGDPVAP